MPRRSVGWMWAGRVVAGLTVAGLVAYLAVVGLDRADKIGSAAGVVVAVLGLLAPYLLAPRRQSPAEGNAPPPEAGAPAPPETGAPAPPGRIDAHGSQGVQVNLAGINTQNNTFGSR
ncbi:hypothetical protein ACIBCR_03285 [Micromonospora echinospora]|uniref:hypothetical protein n=1 Tax=Micromonospora echinospora TaxID=1877 RepID=UPI0037B5E948